MNKTFNPFDILLSITKRWWLSVISMIVGGLCALLFTHFISPLYEASASFSVTIDYTRTGALSDVQEDQAMRGIGYVIDSDEVIERVIEQVKLQLSTFSRNQFEKDSYLERGEFQWTLRYRSSDPEFAEKVAHAWVEVSNSIIQDGLLNARIINSETDVLWGLEDCLERSTGKFSDAGLCGYASIQELMSGIEQVSKSIHERKAQSKGLFSFLAVQIVQRPRYPDFPVRHQTNLLIMMGVVVGLVLSVITQVIYYFFRGLDIEE